MTTWCRRALICLAFLGVLASGRDAFAQKSGNLMFNFKFGPAIGVNDAATQFALQLEFGFAVTGDRNGYLTFPLQFHFGEGVVNGHVPIAFQYDIPIRAVRGLYLYPRFMLGFSFFTEEGPGPNDPSAVGMVLGPGFGIKYVLRGRFNFMFEPFHLPIAVYFDDFGSFVSVWYGLNFGFGFNF